MSRRRAPKDAPARPSRQVFELPEGERLSEGEEDGFSELLHEPEADTEYDWDALEEDPPGTDAASRPPEAR